MTRRTVNASRSEAGHQEMSQDTMATDQGGNNQRLMWRLKEESIQFLDLTKF